MCRVWKAWAVRNVKLKALASRKGSLVIDNCTQVWRAVKIKQAISCRSMGACFRKWAGNCKTIIICIEFDVMSWIANIFENHLHVVGAQAKAKAI